MLTFIVATRAEVATTMSIQSALNAILTQIFSSCLTARVCNSARPASPQHRLQTRTVQNAILIAKLVKVILIPVRVVLKVTDLTVRIACKEFYGLSHGLFLADFSLFWSSYLRY
jgi:hypothetical protein